MVALRISSSSEYQLGEAGTSTFWPCVVADHDGGSVAALALASATVNDKSGVAKAALLWYRWHKNISRATSGPAMVLGNACMAMASYWHPSGKNL